MCTQLHVSRNINARFIFRNRQTAAMYQVPLTPKMATVKGPLIENSESWLVFNAGKMLCESSYYPEKFFRCVCFPPGKVWLTGGTWICHGAGLAAYSQRAAWRDEPTYKFTKDIHASCRCAPADPWHAKAVAFSLFVWWTDAKIKKNT